MTTETKRRRSRGDGGVYQRGSDGLWVGTVDLGYRDGKRRRKAVYGKTKTEALRKLRKAQGELQQYGDLATNSPTLSKWLDIWLTEIAAQKIKPGTLRMYRTYVNEYIKPALGNKRLDKLTPADVRGLARYVMNKGKGLSPTTARNAHRVLSAALRAAVREGAVNRNVASRDYVDAPSKAVSDRKGLTAEQAVKVLKAAKDDRLYSRWLFAFLTGARQGETLGLRWQYVDLEAGTVELAWSLTQVPWNHGCSQDKLEHRADHCPQRHLEIAPGFEYEVLHGNKVLMRPKSNGSHRTVPLAEPLLRALEARKLDVALERDGHQVDHDLVFCRKTGHPIESRKDWQEWRDLLTSAGVPPVTLHETRNTTISLLRELGVDDNTAQQIAGHAEVLTTRGYQRKDDLRHAREAVGKLGDVLTIE